MDRRGGEFLNYQSRVEKKLLKNILKKNPHFILPLSRRNEVISFIKSGLKDLSISRTSFKWGIKVEGTKKPYYVCLD